MLHTHAYHELVRHFTTMYSKSILDLFTEDTNRFAQFHLSHDKLIFDFSKNNITQFTLDKLIALANEKGLSSHIKAMFSGQKINTTENRPALHTALRASGKPIMVDGHDISKDIKKLLQQMQQFSDKLHSHNHLGYTGQKITDIVNIGIGGSNLGVEMLAQALKPYRKNNLQIHFISSIDGYALQDLLSQLDFATTLFIVASKTFTTQETMTNALTIRSWFLDKTNNNHEAIKQHFIAISTNTKAVNEFGIDTANMFQFWNFVGGRYSISGAIGLPIALYIGFENFNQFILGARSMDEHFANTSNFHQNLPVVLALIGIWYINFYNYNSLVISPYNTRLGKLPSYIQQLDMESNGKSIDKNGEKLGYKTAPIIFGDSGINAQHAYYQLLHQGTHICPMDIILSLSATHSNKEHQDILVSNAYAQAEAFMRGKTYNEAKTELLALGANVDNANELALHNVFAGNRPTNMLLLPEISPYYLGMIVALYEHKIFVQGVIWNINSFDQFGVELGKKLTNNILSDIKHHQLSAHSDSTNNLIKLYIK